MSDRGHYCDCRGCRYEIEPDTGSPTFTNHCREARALLIRARDLHLYTAEGYAAHVAYLEHTRPAWPAEWFEPDGKYKIYPTKGGNSSEDQEEV